MVRSWIGVLLLACASAGASERLELRYQALDLPGIPVQVIPFDLNGDARRDLALVVAYSQWVQAAFEEHSEMEGIEGLVEILTIVPSVEDRRELWTFRAEESGDWVPAGPPLELGPEVLAVQSGGPRFPLVALTDRGVSAIGPLPSGSLAIEEVLVAPPVMAASGVFLPDLEWVRDVVGDGTPDLLVPSEQGILVFRGIPEGFAEEPQVVRLPETASEDPGVVDYPLPEIRDVTGDGVPDLVWQDVDSGWKNPSVAVNRSRRDFAPPEAVSVPPPLDELEAIYFGQVDGQGGAELVLRREEAPDEDLGFREEMRLAGSPPFDYQIHHVGPDGELEEEPYTTFRAIGYTFAGATEIQLPGGLQDLEGTGRLALVSTTIDISLRRALGALATHRLTLPMDFYVTCQEPSGAFRAVPGVDLSGKFRLNLERVEVRGLPMFDGDFDGDGRTDFVQFGRGEKVTIHLGRAGCSYPVAPDLVLRLRQEAALMELIRIDDLDADGSSDLLIIQPGRRSDGIETPGVRLDIYRSGGVR